MRDQAKLFLLKNPYDARAKKYFLPAVRDAVRFHAQNCPAYADLLNAAGFSPERLVSEDDLWRIPMLPTLYCKRNALFCVPEERLRVRATSSGTAGHYSRVGFDRATLFYGFWMLLRMFAYKKALSVLPVNYIVLGYEPSAHTQMGAVKTAYAATKFAPALHRTYALKDAGDRYEPNLDGVRAALLRYAKSGVPVRFVGFPSYFYFLLRSLKERGVSLKLNRRSMALLGGGWKQFSGEEIDREQLLRLMTETLGIPRENCLEFFSAVEHPLPYVKCENGHFHVPAYSRVIARDVKTLQPLPYGETGLLNFISPLVSSMPLVSVVTDDLGALHPGAACGCGLDAPYFELSGRAGAEGIKTCAADAAERLNGGAT